MRKAAELVRHRTNRDYLASQAATYQHLEWHPEDWGTEQLWYLMGPFQNCVGLKRFGCPLDGGLSFIIQGPVSTVRRFAGLACLGATPAPLTCGLDAPSCSCTCQKLQTTIARYWCRGEAGIGTLIRLACAGGTWMASGEFSVLSS